MARNAQVRMSNRSTGNRQYSYDGGPSDKLSRESNSSYQYVDSKGNMKLTFKQLAIFWSGTAAFMLVAFLLGFSAGKKEGAISVLDQEGEQMVRLELHTPIEPYPKVLESGDVGNVKRPVGPSVVKKTSPVEESKIDFTSNASLQNLKREEVVPDKKVEVQKVTKPAEKFEEIYPGKNLFDAPPVKVQEVEKVPEVVVPVKEVPVAPTAVVKEVVPQPAISVKSLVPKNGWYVQIAAAPNEVDGIRYYEKITAKGMKASLEPAAIKDRSFYRVLVGPFASQSEAMEKRTQVKQAIGTPSEPFIRQVR